MRGLLVIITITTGQWLLQWLSQAQATGEAYVKSKCSNKKNATETEMRKRIEIWGSFQYPRQQEKEGKKGFKIINNQQHLKNNFCLSCLSRLSCLSCLSCLCSYFYSHSNKNKKRLRAKGVLIFLLISYEEKEQGYELFLFLLE